MKINAHIPTQQYGFIELTDLPDDVKAVQDAYNKYAEVPITLTTGNTVRLTDYFGNEIDYDRIAHVYSWGGEVYLSGSVYANSFRKPFDRDAISSAMAKKYGVSAEDIVKMWELKGEASKNFGNAIHQALELEEKYRALGESLGKSGAHEHPVLKTCVEGFLVAHKSEQALNEVLVVDHKTKHAGQIDRLLITGKNKFRVQDFKTNADITKELDIYWKQLEFYKEIIEANGGVVDGLDIFHYNGEWKEYTK